MGVMILCSFPCFLLSCCTGVRDRRGEGWSSTVGPLSPTTQRRGSLHTNTPLVEISPHSLDSCRLGHVQVAWSSAVCVLERVTGVLAAQARGGGCVGRRACHLMWLPHSECRAGSPLGGPADTPSWVVLHHGPQDQWSQDVMWRCSWLGDSPPPLTGGW